MKTNSTRATLVLVACILCSITTWGVTRFHEGNSLTQPMLNAPAYMMRSMAYAAGHSNDTHRYLGRAGTTLDLEWRDQRASYLNEFQNEGPFEHVVLQPFRQGSADRHYWMCREAYAAGQLCKAALLWNPNTTLVLYWTWGSWNTNANETAWAAMMTDYLSNFFEPFADMVQQAVTDRVVHVLPVTAGLLELHRRIEAGAVPGITSIKEFYYGEGNQNQVHLNANGYYLSSLMHLGSSYRHRIAGVGTNYWMIAYFATPNAQTVTLNNAQAEVLQDIAWHVLTNYPRTTVSGIPRIKADTDAPSVPGNVFLSPVSNGVATLSWSPATDDVAVAFYGVIRNDEYIASRTNSPYTISGLTNPVSVIELRAYDASYNYAGTIVVIPECGAAVLVLASALLRRFIAP